MVIKKCLMCKGVKSEKDFTSDKGKLCRNCNKCRSYLKSYGSVKENHERRILQRRERYNTIPEIKKKHANYYQKNKDNIVFKRKKQAIHLRRKYNLTLEDYDSMMAEQNNECAICKEKFTESFKDWNRPCVDHNHQTNKVRGLLCRKCNVTLSYVERFPYWEAAQNYLQARDGKDKEPSR